jgi:hypothetical protein
MTKKTYQVLVRTELYDHPPGETFEAELTENEETRAIERGWIMPVEKTTARKEKKADA